MTNAIQMIRTVLPAITNAGASSIVTLAVSAVIPKNIGRVTKLFYALGGVGIGLVVGNAAEKAMGEMIDEVVENLHIQAEEKKEEENAQVSD